jgi:DNA-binding HxlR family transcriptional regulator
MASSKAHRFDKLLYQQSRYFKVLDYPGRILILEYLFLHGRTSYTTLCKQLPLHEKTVSQHLRALRKENLIEMDEIYPHSFYTLDFREFDKLIGAIKGFFLFFENSKGRRITP